MFKLRYGYLISGIITGFILLITFLWSIPDGKLHMFFCDVGQGDAAYIRLPDGRDMIVDGGPDEKVINCLSRHMPFWDRTIDIVVLTHPQKDHMQGLITVLTRYKVGYFVKSDVGNTSEGYARLMQVVSEKHIPVKLETRGERVTVGASSLSFLWPSRAQITSMHPTGSNVLGAESSNLNDGSLVFWLQYGTFDALLTGDADSHVDHYYAGDMLADGRMEVLKVPHHGSKTGMTQGFVDWVRPSTAIISVGRNSYGHPSKEVEAMLKNIGSTVYRTDKSGDIEVVSDGKGWIVVTHAKPQP